jgi:mannitol/fructose-specific phosphotransferase system IIA component (Ntr-type)
VAFARYEEAIDWGATDGAPVDMAVMLAIPAANASADHLKLLARLSRRMVHEEFREGLRAAPDAEAVVRLFRAALAE